MLLRVTNFSGLAPQADPHLLAENMAQTAINCRLMGGVLGAFKNPRTITTDPQPGHAKSIYRFGQNEALESNYWFTFSVDTDVAKGQIAGDPDERTFMTNGTKPKKTDYALTVGGAGTNYPKTVYDTAVPSPTTAPTVAVVAGTGEGTAEDRYYVYTYVTEWAEESIPSPASLAVSVKNGQTVRVSGLTPPPTGDYDVRFIRIYRTASGSTATDFQFVEEIPVASTLFDDTVLQANLGEVCPSLEYDAPLDTLHGLINLPNGIQAAFSGNDVYFTEPYRPFTFPQKYAVTVDFPVVGLGVYGTNLVVLTKGNPYIISGIDPSAMSSQKLDLQQACVSKRSIVSMGYGVIYASPDGLVLVGDSAQLLSIEAYSKREWSALNPSTITACQYEGRYYAFFAAGGGLIFDNSAKPPIVSQLDLSVTAVFNDLQRDGLYFAGDGTIRRWDDGTGYLSYTWRSKKYELPRHNNFAWGQVLVTDGLPVTLKVYADGVLTTTTTVTDDKPFRLTSGFKSKYWEIELTGTGQVRAALLANTIEELQQV